MHTGLKDVLEFREDQFQIRSQIYFQMGILLNDLLSGLARSFKVKIKKGACIKRVLAITKVSTFSIFVLRILFLCIDEIMIGLRHTF